MGLFSKKKDKDNNENNKETNLNPFAKKADNGGNDDDLDGKKQQQSNANQNQQQQQQQTNPDFKLTDFYKSAGLYEGIDIKEFAAAIRDDDENKAGVILSRVMENAVSVALTSANKLADQKISAIKENVITETKSVAEMDMAVRAMHAELPFTAHEAVAPVAKSVLEGFLKQGLSTDDAVANTKDYYKEVALESAKHFDMDIREKGDNQGFNRSRLPNERDNSNDNANKDVDDWAAILTSGNQTQESLDQEAQQQAQQQTQGKDS